MLEWVVFLFSRGIFPSQGSKPSLLHCRWILYQLSHKGRRYSKRTNLTIKRLGYKLIRKRQYNRNLGGFPGGTSSKEPACQCRRCKRCGFNLWVRKIPWKRAWQPSPVFLPGEFHGQRSLAAYGPWGHRQSDTPEA